MTVFTYEKSKRTGACRDFLESSGLLGNCEMLTILPIPSTRDGVNITGTDKTLLELSQKGRAGEVYLGYGLPDFVTSALKESGAVVVDAASDEAFLSENARLTALAVVSYILSGGELSPEGRRIGIVGYGRIGKALLRLLLPLGACVTVYSTREGVVCCLNASGVDAVLVSEGAELPDCELLVNTAPAKIFDTGGAKRRKTKVLELASGDNFEGVDAIRLPALPNRYFPVSAGIAYARALLRGMGGCV